MAKSTREKQLARARANRDDARALQQRATRLVVSLVAVLVVGSVALGVVLLSRAGDDPAVDIAADTETVDDAAAADAAVDDEAAGAAPAEAPVDAVPCPAPEGAVPEPRTEPYGEAPGAELAGADSVTATLVTTCGDVVIDLDLANTPGTVENFVALAEDDYYDGVPFHRVIDGFMVQSGDPTGTGSGCVDENCETQLPGYQIADELSLAEEIVASDGLYPRGVIAMANTGRPDSGGSQFFIVQATAGYGLPPTYAIFGEVTEGMAVVDRIAAGEVVGDLALEPVIVRDVVIDRGA